MRGDVYRVKAPRNAVGHEQSGQRYAIVIQSDDLMLSTLLVAPTSRSAGHAMHRPVVEIGGQESRVLVEQAVCIDPSRLGSWAGRVSYREMREINEALRLVFDLL